MNDSNNEIKERNNNLNNEIIERDKNSSKFMTSLEQNLIIDEKSLKSYQSSIENINNLLLYIKAQENMTKEINTKIKVDIGNGVFVDAEKEPKNTIILNIGLDIYVEVDFKFAVSLLNKKKEILIKRSELTKNEIIKNKAYYKLTNDLSDQLQRDQLINGKIEDDKINENILI